MRSNNMRLSFHSQLLNVCLLVLLSSYSLTALAINDELWLQTARNGITSINQQIENFDSSSDNKNQLVVLERKLAKYKTRAENCIADTEPQITRRTTDLLNITGSGKAADGTSSDKGAGVNELATKAEIQFKLCQEILLNAVNLSDRIQTLRTNMLTEYLLSRGTTLTEILQLNFISLDTAVTSLTNFAENRIQVTSFNSIEWLVFLSAVFFSWFLGAYFGKKLIVRAGRIPGETVTEGLFAAIYSCLGKSLPLLMASFAAVSVIAVLLPLTPLPTSIAVFGSLAIYLLTIITARILLNPCPPAKHFLQLNTYFSTSLYKRLQFLLVLGLFAVLVFSLNLKEVVTQPQWELIRASFMTLAVVNLVWLSTYLSRAPGLLGNTLLRSLLMITLSATLIAEYIGFHNLAVYLFKGIIGSLFLGIALWIIYTLLHDTLDSLDEGRHRWQKRLRAKLQLEKDEPVPGMLWIRLFSVLVLWMFFAISMMQLWRYSDSGWLWLLQNIQGGFDLGSFKIKPLQILFGIGLFAILLTLVRWFRQDTLPKWVRKTRLDHGGREAVVKISGYIGVLVAALLGLSIAGFDFTNLAIIAGALSVGIGFGMQNIVNNFVSGIILLFERPIRTGDWIVVGNTEGYVRKISIRSTQIETFDRADVIVPNSELISNQVTNWMLHDPWGRVTVPVGVAYGSNAREVEKLLVACAMEHPLVMKESHDVSPPRVIFRGFGDNSLNFELRAFIQQVDQRLSTLSDLNFAIEESFRENGIAIPFPQRDLHLRSVDPSIVFSRKEPEKSSGSD